LEPNLQAFHILALVDVVVGEQSFRFAEVGRRKGKVSELGAEGSYA
jgi:hypothetical protein